MHDRRESTYDGLTLAGSPSPQRVRWGAVFAGVVLGLALLALLTTLWFALAYNSNVDVVRDNLEWFIGGTAVAALFLGGLLSGWLSGVRGPGSGFFNGITMWGLILIVAVAVGLPAVFNIFDFGPVTITGAPGIWSPAIPCWCADPAALPRFNSPLLMTCSCWSCCDSSEGCCSQACCTSRQAVNMPKGSS